MRDPKNHVLQSRVTFRNGEAFFYDKAVSQQSGVLVAYACTGCSPLPRTTCTYHMIMEFSPSFWVTHELDKEKGPDDENH